MTQIGVRVEVKITDEKRLIIDELKALIIRNGTKEYLIIDELKALIIRNGTKEYLPFNNVDQGKLRDVTKKVNELIRHIETDGVTQSNKLAMAAGLCIAKEVRIKKCKIGEKKEPRWKRRIESDFANLRKDINRLEREIRGETGGKGKRKIKERNLKYRVKKMELLWFFKN